MPVSSATDRASRPSWARCSRVPSVATSSTPRPCSPRANALMPSRVATDSSARTRCPPRPAGSSAGSHPRGWVGDPGRASSPGYEMRRRVVGPEYTRGRGILGRMTMLPWQYFFVAFDKRNFPDLFDPTWIASLVLLVVLIVLYNLRTRALHRHRLYTDMWEWLLWTGLITFFLLATGALFLFDFAVELFILVAGLGALGWVRFLRYPPLFAAYEYPLARQR